ncbi:uncharacterized protein UBRO_20964 [Ustilago bromivora]|uniref:Reverse transcriptase domain-containing protein n=1 Tax=Ustilago bromivora TaxID=307758 RepID=A0A1K0GDP8_9BASI|nr:uncharacterized protein UBRO_20964 [Ustilago bromivora]
MLPPTTQLASGLPTPLLPTPQATCSHQSPFSSATKTICAGPTFAPASSVITLGAQVDSINSRISRLEDTIHLNFTTILTHIDSLQSSPHPPSTPTSLPTITSQPPLPETPAQAGLVFMDGQVRITKESSEQRSSSFAKVIPNICVLAQVWLVYTAICIHHTRDLDLNNALLAYLEIIIEFNQIYLWKGVTKYHLAICHQRFDLTFVPTATKNILSNRAALAAGSSRPTPTPPRRVLNDRAMSPTTTGSGPAVTLLPASSSPGSGLANMMLPAFSPPGSSLVDMLLPAPSSSGSSLADMLQPTSPSLGSGLTGGMFLVTSLGSGLVDQKLSATLPSTSCAPSASSAMLVPSLDFFMPQGITDMSPDSASTLLVSLLTGPAPQAHPNTACELPIFNHSDTPTTVGSLKLEHWAPFLNLYPDQDFANQLRGALHHGTLLGYSGPLHHTTWLEGSNLPMDLDDELHLCREIEARVLEGCLQWVNDPGAACLVCSPVGVVPKPHSDKQRTIYHLSHPCQLGVHLPSVNDGIHHLFVSILYETFDTIIDFVCRHQGTSLWKADLEDAFRHVLMAEGNARLMGFHFDGLYYQECALAFGGRLSPFLFNFFAKFLHWVTSFALRSASPSPTSHSEAVLSSKAFAVQSPTEGGVAQNLQSRLTQLVSLRMTGSTQSGFRCATAYNYLDDFFGTSDPAFNASTLIQALSIALAALGFCLSCKKTVWSTTHLEILGIELDSVAQTASITDQHHQCILWLCQRIIIRDRASLLELQQVTGHLQFVTWVAPHGRAFLQHIHDMVKSHHQAPFGHHISRATCDELMCITTPPSSFVATTKLSKQAAFLLWDGLAPTTCLHSTKICSDFATFVSTMSHSPQPFPVTVLALIEWAAHYHEHAKTYHMVKRSIAVLSEFTWEMLSSPPLLTVGSVKFAEDESYATVFLPSCKTDPFGTGVTLTAPAVPLTTCVVKALKVICWHCSASEPLFAFKGGLPFDHNLFITTIHRCLQACGIPPEGYSGHSFQHGAATWAAANRTDSNMIQGLGHWRSDCFRRYVNTLAAECAATSASALYSNADQPLNLSQPAWHNF